MRCLENRLARGALRALGYGMFMAVGATAVAAGPSGLDRGLSIGKSVAAADADAGGAKAAAHALIMVIGAYPEGLPSLRGSARDVDNARAIARGFGVADEHMTVLRDGELTLDRIEAARVALNRLAGGDEELFVYFSGLGGLDCADGASRPALLGADGKPLSESAFERGLRELAGKTRRVIAFIDVGRAPVGETADAGLTGKYWHDPATCAPAGATRGLAVGKDPYAGSNFVRLTGVADGEPAYDSPELGGLATHAWAECLAGRAVDIDASSGLSVHELQACAAAVQRQLVAERLPAALDPAPSSGDALTAEVAETVTGNAAMVIADAPVETVAEGRDGPDPVAALRDILANADQRRQVILRSSQEAYRIGKEEVAFEVHSSHAGYVYLLMVGSDGQTFDLLFPNRKDADNHIQAGAVMHLPRASWRIRPGGPAGTDHLLAIVSDTPRDFSGLALRAAGPFSIAGATHANTRGLRVATERPADASTPGCARRAGMRTLQIVEAEAEAAPARSEPAVGPDCVNSYGADLIAIQEIE